MSSHIEYQMESYLNQMESLQTKMTELQKTKVKQEEDQENKLNNIEPNMAVIENWLKSVVRERENTQKAKKLYESLMKDTQHRISPEKRQEIWKLRNIYYNNQLEKWMPPNEEPLFHEKKHKAPDKPSQFMIDFIEATHNLFQIQQKRIEELENVVADLNAKINP